MILRKELRPFQWLWHFLLHDGVGRLLLGTSMLVMVNMLGHFLLSLFPGGVANLLGRTGWIAALGLGLFLYVSLRREQVKAYVGTGEALRRVYSKMPSAQRPPKPPVWAYGGNWQFMPWMLYNLFSAKFQPLDFEKSYLTVRGLKDTRRRVGGKKRRCMEDEVILNFFPSTSSKLRLDAPTILVEPGLMTCTAQDVPGSSFLRRAVDRGFRVVVIERRGHAQPLKSPRWNLFGDSDRPGEWTFPVEETLPKAALFWIGFSSGSKLPIEGQGKFDRRRAQGDETAPSFKAMACICPGYNLETCFLGFKFPYRQIGWSRKSKFLLENETILRSFNAEAFEQAYNAPDLQELLSHVAPFAGYDSAKSYFEHENPVRA
ncbi:Abhydrolase domain-containing protein 3 [Durusdinium trenchii]|uniref:Abhydrolase domain-containing protein 3 n=1 Tax=Durusdinium trenchii TaxID=1381693 RepID=A0ABP0PIC2_9DINO